LTPEDAQSAKHGQKRCESLAVCEPNRKRHNGPLPITLPGQKLQFEEERRDCTYCAFFTDLQDGVAHEIRKAAQGLKSAGNVAFAKHGLIERELELGPFEHGYLVVNWSGSSSNLYKQLKYRLHRPNVSSEGGAGKLVWIRPMKPYLKKRLETAMGLVYPPDGTF